MILLRSSSKKVNKDLGLSTNWKITFTGESNFYMFFQKIHIIDCIHFLKIAKKFVWLGYNWQMSCVAANFNVYFFVKLSTVQNQFSSHDKVFKGRSHKKILLFQSEFENSWFCNKTSHFMHASTHAHTHKNYIFIYLRQNQMDKFKHTIRPISSQMSTFNV